LFGASELRIFDKHERAVGPAFIFLNSVGPTLLLLIQIPLLCRLAYRPVLLPAVVFLVDVDAALPARNPSGELAVQKEHPVSLKAARLNPSPQDGQTTSGFASLVHSRRQSKGQNALGSLFVPVSSKERRTVTQEHKSCCACGALAPCQRKTIRFCRLTRLVRSATRNRVVIAPRVQEDSLFFTLRESRPLLPKMR